MRKKNIVVLILVLSMSLVTACGSKSESEIYEDASRVLVEELNNRGFPEAFTSEKNFGTVEEVDDNYYIVTGNAYMQNGNGIGFFEVKLFYGDGDRMDYEWRID